VVDATSSGVHQEPGTAGNGPHQSLLGAVQDGARPETPHEFTFGHLAKVKLVQRQCVTVQGAAWGTGSGIT
jgi:hypothetical protein